MNLRELLSAIEYRAEYVPDADICDLVYDSRIVKPGCAFVCLRGANVDGHQYAAMAAEKGAAVIIAEEPVAVDIPHWGQKTSLSFIWRPHLVQYFIRFLQKYIYTVIIH